jgi:hypothetical protein
VQTNLVIVKALNAMLEVSVLLDYAVLILDITKITYFMDRKFALHQIDQQFFKIKDILKYAKMSRK